MAGTPEQQALVALQQELAQSRAQVLAVTQRLDQLTQSHQQLNSEADRLFREKADQISALETRLSATLFKQGFDLLDLKSMRPERFDGKRNEAWKPWQRKFKAYCNGKAQGFRSALEWAELQPGPLQGNFHGCPWPKVLDADAKLHDFLCATLGGVAGLLAETVGLEGQGFEVWRRLSAKYAPTGGQFEIDTLIQLLNPNQPRTSLPCLEPLPSLSMTSGNTRRGPVRSSPRSTRWRLWCRSCPRHRPQTSNGGLPMASRTTRPWSSR